MKYVPSIAKRLVTPATFFRRYVKSSRFPCVGAKSALATRTLDIFTAWNLEGAEADEQIIARLRKFASKIDDASALVSLAAIFPMTREMSEEQFEAALWGRLMALHALDRETSGWDPKVSADPEDPHFGMSFGGKAFFVVGLHPHASRRARRAPFAALIFNAHDQFDRLRADGRYGTMQTLVRERERALQGSLNPMLSEHGEASEASQYSGRRVPSDWRCPFQPTAE